ncbi:unnamed protein product [Colias eurytheme]|nr:unnamed protein product [Colias eurytheme]
MFYFRNQIYGVCATSHTGAAARKQKKIEKPADRTPTTTQKEPQLQNKLASASKMIMDRALEKVTANMTLAAKIITKLQCRESYKKSKGRRFTLKEKVLSLSMYKRSPKCYTLLASYFCLPSAKALKRLLAKVEIESGMNKAVFLKMKETVKALSPQDRLCCLIFDEMSITPQIQYDAAKDKLKGFAWGSKTFADHVLVYLVKGIRKNFKQPVAYYFTSCLKKSNLKEITLNIIRYVQRTGLNVLCTVCDQSATNVAAINEMIEETKKKYFQQNKEWRHSIIEVSGKQIVPLFDVPHLIKGVRNNLLTKDMKYFDFEEQVEKIIKWQYYQQVYEADQS